MKVIDAETGQPFHLHMDDEVKAELASHYESRNCGHPNPQIRRAVVGGGQVQYKQQCLECGDSVGTAIAHSKAPSDVPEFDVTIAEKRKTTHAAQYEAIIQKHVKLQKAKGNTFWKKYQTYLKSPAWAAKRARVLKRANGMCEGCLEKQATQVHHLSYKHCFDEFLFELVAVCDDCHTRLHNSEADDSAPVADEILEDYVDDETTHESPCCACRHQDERGCEPWCSKFDLAASAAMAFDGPCGPRQAELEPLK